MNSSESLERRIIDAIPDITEVQEAYPAGKGIDDVYKALAEIAKEHNDDWGEKFFSKVFFEGGRMPKPKEGDWSKDDQTRVSRWVRAAIGSYGVQHEVKSKVCGMLWQLFFTKPDDL